MVKDYEVVLAGFRKQFPQYADVPGETLINSLQQKYYSDLSIDEVAQAIAGKWGSPLDTSAKEADYSGTALDTMRQKRAHHSGTGDVIDYRDETEGLRALVEHMRDNGLNENEIVEACKTAQFSEQDVRERCGDLLK